MGLSAPLRTARAALLRNRVRTALTTLGISIGIAAVICTEALGRGSTAAVQQQVAAMGDSFIWIQAGSARNGGARSGWGTARTLTAADGAAIVANVPRVKACSPQVSGREQLVVSGENWNTRYTGIAPQYLAIRRWRFVDGGAFAQADVVAAAKVLILGANVAQTLFGDERAVGRTIRMGPFPFIVIGVLQSRGASGAGTNQDDQVFLPYTTAQKKLSGKTWIDGLVCSTMSTDDIPRVEATIPMLLRERHRIGPGENDDFNLRSPVEMLALREQTTRTLALMLSAIAAVSLLVGGIGIMNIMLVSVTERTREIGLRLAIGARSRDITRQFLAEALMLGGVGGVTGVLGGIGGAALMTAAFGWPTALSVNGIVLATACALVASLIFGYYPAVYASGLDPIEALRVET